MNPETNKKIIIGAAVIIGIVLVIVIASYLAKGPSAYQGGVQYPGEQAGGASAQQQSQTRTSVSGNVSVPGTTSTVSSDVAKPKVVAEAAPGSTSSFRSFSLSVSGNEFNPSNVNVYVGDNIQLNITAVDKDYDFFQPDYGLSKTLPKGQSTLIGFQASAEGKYTFYCKSCGGPDKGPVGYIVVVPKK